MRQNYVDDRDNPLRTPNGPQARSTKAMEFDNLIRRSLRVSDPGNFDEIADALGKKFPLQKRDMDYEAAGFSFTQTPGASTRREVPTSTGAEFEQAHLDVEKDLKALINNALLKDIKPELNGWASSIRRAVADGFNTARFALDPNQRDRAMGVRGLLGKFARIARYVGAARHLMIEMRQTPEEIGIEQVLGIIGSQQAFPCFVRKLGEEHQCHQVRALAASQPPASSAATQPGNRP